MVVGLVPIARRAVAARDDRHAVLDRDADDHRRGRRRLHRRHRGGGGRRVPVPRRRTARRRRRRARAREHPRPRRTSCPRRRWSRRTASTREVAAEQLAVGSIILVRPGDRIAADGEIVDGESAIDEAPVTGESVPKRKTPGDDVFAGTINGEAVLRVRVTAAAADNTIARDRPAGRGSAGEQGADRALHRPLLPLLHAGRARRRRAGRRRAAAARSARRGTNGSTRASPCC